MLAVAGITVRETGLPISLERGDFLSCLHAPPLCCVTAFASPEPGSLLQPCQPCRWYCPSMERHICHRFLLSHRGFLPSGFLKFLCKVPMEWRSERQNREMLWGGRYGCLEKEGCGGGYAGPETCNVPDTLGSTISVDFSFHLNKKISALLINDFY